MQRREKRGAIESKKNHRFLAGLEEGLPGGLGWAVVMDQARGLEVPSEEWNYIRTSDRSESGQDRDPRLPLCSVIFMEDHSSLNRSWKGVISDDIKLISKLKLKITFNFFFNIILDIFPPHFLSVLGSIESV